MGSLFVDYSAVSTLFHRNVLPYPSKKAQYLRRYGPHSEKNDTASAFIFVSCVNNKQVGCGTFQIDSGFSRATPRLMYSLS